MKTQACARRSHRLMRDIRIALCEMFASLYARCSYRSMRDIRSVRIEMSVTVGIRCLSNVGETLYPMLEIVLIQGRINLLSKSDDKTQSVSWFKINNVRSGNNLTFYTEAHILNRCNFEFFQNSTFDLTFFVLSVLQKSVSQICGRHLKLYELYFQRLILMSTETYNFGWIKWKKYFQFLFCWFWAGWFLLNRQILLQSFWRRRKQHTGRYVILLPSIGT